MFNSKPTKTDLKLYSYNMSGMKVSGLKRTF